jgi:hypothetical protein
LAAPVKIKPSIVLRLVAAGLLFLALAKHPDVYYEILRWVACGTAVFCAYVANANDQKPFIVPFILIAILFNPLSPIYLHGDTWRVINILTGIYLLGSIFLVGEKARDEK